MWWFFKHRQKKEEISLPFLENGSALLAELVAFSNGRYSIPIRCFTAHELVSATNNFAERVELTELRCMYKGSIEERLILVKKFSDEDISSRTFYGAIRDIVITSQMSHLKNVFKLAGCCLEFKHPALVYECVRFELLANLLRQSPNDERFFSWEKRVKIAMGVANAILYLHTAFATPVIFRDLKPSKVIIDEYGVAKLFDFSTSISLPPGESHVEDVEMGTCGFIDPEYCTSGFINQKTDVYSFGALLLVLLTGQESRCKNSEGETIDIVEYVKDQIEKDQLIQIVDPKISKAGFDLQQHLQAFLDLAMRCTHVRGEDRPEMIDVAKELREIEKCVKC